MTACPTKVVPGLYGFVAQLNEGRYSKKRPTEFRVDQVIQPFDTTKFNFTKVCDDTVGMGPCGLGTVVLQRAGRQQQGYDSSCRDSRWLCDVTLAWPAA